MLKLNENTQVWDRLNQFGWIPAHEGKRVTIVQIGKIQAKIGKIPAKKVLNYVMYLSITYGRGVKLSIVKMKDLDIWQRVGTERNLYPKIVFN